MNRLRAISRAGTLLFNRHRHAIRDQGSGSESLPYSAPSASGWAAYVVLNIDRWLAYVFGLGW